MGWIFEEKNNYGEASKYKWNNEIRQLGSTYSGFSLGILIDSQLCGCHMCLYVGVFCRCLWCVSVFVE